MHADTSFWAARWNEVENEMTALIERAVHSPEQAHQVGRVEKVIHRIEIRSDQIDLTRQTQLSNILMQ